MTDKDRIEYCRKIIKQKPNTAAARNAKRLIADLKMQQEASRG